MRNSSKLAFVGTYTEADEDGVFGFRIDSGGTLHQTNAWNGGEDPTFLCTDPDREHLYVANRPEGGGDVIAYEIHHDAGTLTYLNTAPTNGDGTPCHCSVDATGQYVLTAQYGGGTVSVLPIDREGRVSEPTTILRHEGSGPNEERQSEPHPHSIQTGPDNEYAYVPDLGADRVFIYDFDPNRGALEPADCGHVDVEPGAGPRHLDFHPNGQYVYLINELDSTIVAFERNTNTGALNAIATETTLPDDFEGENQTADIHVHPSGEYLYGSNRGHDSIAIYAVDDHGRPSIIDIEPTLGEWPRNFAIHPSGEFLFAGNADTGNIVTFRIEDDGTLRPTGDEIRVPSPVCMIFVDG